MISSFWGFNLCVFFVFWGCLIKTIGRIQESIETFFSSMSAGAQALYEDRTKTATLIGGLTLLAGGVGLVGVLYPGLVGQIWTWVSQKQTTRGCRIFQGSRTDILKDSYRCGGKCSD